MVNRGYPKGIICLSTWLYIFDNWNNIIWMNRHLVNLVTIELRRIRIRRINQSTRSNFIFISQLVYTVKTSTTIENRYNCWFVELTWNDLEITVKLTVKMTKTIPKLILGPNRLDNILQMVKNKLETDENKRKWAETEPKMTDKPITKPVITPIW